MYKTNKYIYTEKYDQNFFFYFTEQDAQFKKSWASLF